MSTKRVVKRRPRGEVAPETPKRALQRRLLEYGRERAAELPQGTHAMRESYARGFAEAAFIYEEIREEQKVLLRELDVMFNGERGAARAPTLGDIVHQLRRELPLIYEKFNSNQAEYGLIDAARKVSERKI